MEDSTMRNIIGQKRSAFKFTHIMDNGKIFLANLSKGSLGEMNCNLLGFILVTRFYAAAMRRARMPIEKRKDFFLYVDEFQNFATKTFGSILSEARKFHLPLILANQFVSQVPLDIRESLFGNVGSVIALRIGSTDAEVMEKIFTPCITQEDLINQPNWNAYARLMVNGQISLPFSMQTVLESTPPDPGMAGRIKNITRKKYGKPRKEVEEEINKRIFGGRDAIESLKKEVIDNI